MLERLRMFQLPGAVAVFHTDSFAQPSRTAVTMAHYVCILGIAELVTCFELIARLTTVSISQPCSLSAGSSSKKRSVAEVFSGYAELYTSAVR